MIYLQSFHMLTQEENRENCHSKPCSIGYTTSYPFVLFRERCLPDFYFDDIAVFAVITAAGKALF